MSFVIDPLGSPRKMLFSATDKKSSIFFGTFLNYKLFDLSCGVRFSLG